MKYFIDVDSMTLKPAYLKPGAKNYMPVNVRIESHYILKQTAHDFGMPMGVLLDTVVKAALSSKEDFEAFLAWHKERGDGKSTEEPEPQTDPS